MIGSFRQTLIWWMTGQLSGEVYVAPSPEVQVPEDFYEVVREYPGVGGVDPYRNVQIAYHGSPVYLSAVDASVLREFATFHWFEGGAGSWERVTRGAVLVSESFSRRFHIGMGDTVELEAVEGLAVLEVAGVFYDYTTEHGLVMMDRSTYLLLFRDRTIDSLGVFLEPGAEREDALAAVRTSAAKRGLPVVSRDELHGSILEVFDATFAVTRSMRVLGVLVAFCGIAGALMTLYLERRRDFGIYRALGFSVEQVALMTLLEGLAMGGASLILSLVLGSLFSLVLIHVINLQSFHWSIFLQPLWGPYAVAAATAIAASLGAAAYPIWKVCRTYPQLQIRED
jgi:putative ABC transport system permease protein